MTTFNNKLIHTWHLAPGRRDYDEVEDDTRCTCNNVRLKQLDVTVWNQPNLLHHLRLTQREPIALQICLHLYLILYNSFFGWIYFYIYFIFIIIYYYLFLFFIFIFQYYFKKFRKILSTSFLNSYYFFNFILCTQTFIIQ